jgi:hypothetical protein
LSKGQKTKTMGRAQTAHPKAMALAGAGMAMALLGLVAVASSLHGSRTELIGGIQFGG